MQTWAVPGRPQRSFCGQSEGTTQELSTKWQCPGHWLAPAGSPHGIYPQVPSRQTLVKVVWPSSHCSCLVCLEHLLPRDHVCPHKGRPCNAAPTETGPISKLTVLTACIPHAVANHSLLDEAYYLTPGLFISPTPHLLGAAGERVLSTSLAFPDQLSS